MKEIRNQLLDCLEHNILDYWLTLRDPNGGFKGEVLSDGTVLEDAPRGVILNARIIWTFAAVYGMFPKPEYLAAAQHAKEYFLEHFIDKEYGGVYWSVTALGRPLETKKQLYSQGFAIYGLSELYKVTREEEVLEKAIDLYNVVERYYADHKNGGYREALARDFSPLEDMSLSAHDINAQKTMNSHLHILEAYANLYQVWPDRALKSRVESLLDIVCTRIMAPGGHLQLYFADDWSVLPGGISYGHDIETSWLALECAMALKDNAVIDRVKPAALKMGHAGNEGLLPDGSLRYEQLQDGSRDDSRQWWVQAEAVVGNLWLWKHHGLEEGLRNAINAWKYIREHLIDNEKGEWYWAILPGGEPDLANPKAGFWKCPYHNSRMCLEALKILK